MFEQMVLLSEFLEIFRHFSNIVDSYATTKTFDENTILFIDSTGNEA